MEQGADPGALAGDLLEGAAEISRFLFGENANPRRAYRALEARQIPAWRVGNRWFARRSRLIRWIEEMEDKGAASAVE